MKAFAFILCGSFCFVFHKNLLTALENEAY